MLFLRRGGCESKTNERAKAGLLPLNLLDFVEWLYRKYVSGAFLVR